MKLSQRMSKVLVLQAPVLILLLCSVLIRSTFSSYFFSTLFGIKSVVLNAELPQNSRLHILEEFNAGLFDYLIATDDNKIKEKEQTSKETHSQPRTSKKHLRQKLDTEFGVVRGIDFKNVFTDIYTGLDVQEGHITQDVAKSITKLAVRESRAQDLRNEILNSEKLKAHFEDNPRDLDLLKHDKLLSKKAPPAHLRDVPDSLSDPKVLENSKMVKLSRAAMGINKSRRRPGFRREPGKNRDPLKTFSIERKKKRTDKNGEAAGNNKRKKAKKAD